MRLNHISLRNYKQHSELEQDIEGNIIVVVGPNGKGKSNLMGAFNFALSGEQPGSTREDLLQWGAFDGHVALDLTHNGTDGQVVRQLHNTSASFKFGSDDYNGITKVAGGLYEHLGWDKDLGKQSVFVQQAKLDAVLFNDPRERELTFQRLMGIQHADKVNKSLGTLISGWSLPPNYDEQIADGNVRYADLKTRLQGLQGELTSSETTRSSCPDIEELQARLAAVSSFQTTLARYTTLTAELDRVTGLMSSASSQLAAINIPDIDIATLDAQISQLQTVISAAENYQRVTADYKQAGESIMKLGESPCTEQDLAAMEGEAAEMARVYNEANAELQLRAGLLTTLQTQGAHELAECPLCGSDILDAESLQQRLSLVVKQLQEGVTRNNPTVKQGEHRQLQQAHQTHAARQAMLYESYAKAQAALDGADKDDSDPVALRAQAATMIEQRQAVLIQIDTQSSLKATLAATEGQQMQITQEVDQLEDLLAKQQLPKLLEVMRSVSHADAANQAKAEAAEIQQGLTDIQALDQHLAKLRGMVLEIENSIEELGKTIATLEGKRSQQSARTDCIDTLTRVRDWFNYKNGPRTMATSVLEDMTGDVNDFLTQFSAPYTVYPSDEAFGFRYVKHDGSPMPDDPPDTKHLSGGERVQLAISFRFANYCMFASKLGLLSLDEPTVYLDDRNIGRFCTLMEKIRKVAQDMDLQVMIATHERSILPFADTVIDLSEIA